MLVISSASSEADDESLSAMRQGMRTGAGIFMDASIARAVARRVHNGQVDRRGDPLIKHVERVAQAVPPDVRALAYLHDILEHAGPSELSELALTDQEWDVLGLLTRRQSESYKLYVLRITRAAGTAGAIARAIKLADLDDHLRHRQHRAQAPNYTWARRQVRASQHARGEVGSGGDGAQRKVAAT
jgi:hypothetical protein